ncbi:MAG: hypothetical protein GC181_06965 [Bacteroidetes bacterium]|nr:hypothetical protein [Bacteroidota bacterium]
MLRVVLKYLTLCILLLSGFALKSAQIDREDSNSLSIERLDGRALAQILFSDDINDQPSSTISNISDEEALKIPFCELEEEDDEWVSSRKSKNFNSSNQSASLCGTRINPASALTGSGSASPESEHSAPVRRYLVLQVFRI